MIRPPELPSTRASDELMRWIPLSQFCAMGARPIFEPCASDTAHASLVSNIELMPDLRGRLLAHERSRPSPGCRGRAAEALFTPADTDDLAYFLKHLPVDIPVTVIGLASNMIIRDGGIPGVVIRFRRVPSGRWVEEGHRIRAGAFAADRKVAIEAAEAGIGGLEFLFGIPGSVGGALRMNAGTRSNTNPEIEGETRERFVEATAVTRAGEIIRLGLDDMKFVYRGCGVPRIRSSRKRFSRVSRVMRKRFAPSMPACRSIASAIRKRRSARRAPPSRTRRAIPPGGSSAIPVGSIADRAGGDVEEARELPDRP